MKLQKVNSQIETIRAMEKDGYTDQIETFLKWLASNSLSVNTDSIREYFQMLERSEYKARTVLVKRAAVKNRVRKLFKAAGADFKSKLEAELKDIDDTCKAPRVNSESIDNRKLLTSDEYNLMLSRCRSERQKAILMFLHTTGCRVNEMTGIRLLDCKESDGVIIITVNGKGGIFRDVIITGALYNFIRSAYNGNYFLFETSGGKRVQNDYATKQVKAVGKLIGRNISAHTFRHEWFTRKINQHPGKIQAISKYGGHRNISTTLSMYYQDTLSDDELLNDCRDLDAA